MAALTGGSFTMGDRGDAVVVLPFCLDVTEVTADAFAACVKSGQCAAEEAGGSPPDATCNYRVAGRGDHPMNCVDLAQATTYCQVQGKRLPSEEEWEWAARGGSRGTTYPWGNEAPEPESGVCWKQAGTCAVGTHPASDAPGGIHDLAGNVWEWTTGMIGQSHVYRGGSWGNTEARYLRAATRSRNGALVSYGVLGFRCALTSHR